MSMIFSNASDRSRAEPQPAPEQPTQRATLYERGFSAGDRYGYTRGWRYGLLCGFVAACMLGAVAALPWLTRWAA